jgi:hypothetical protein
MYTGHLVDHYQGSEIKENEFLSGKPPEKRLLGRRRKRWVVRNGL